MRIVVVHSRYLSGDLSGENRVVSDEVDLLQRHGGHDVALYSPTYSVDSGRLRGAVGVVWSRHHANAVRRLVDRVRPDLVHVHSLYPALSPAVLRAVPESVPVVMTLHNFRYACLPATFLRDGRICEDCLGRVPFRGVVHRCYRGSLAASGVLASSLTLHRALGSFARVRLFLAVSGLIRDKLALAGIPRERIRVKPNFAPPSAARSGAGDYVLAVGRLTEEKGFDTVVDAAKQASCRLIVAGDGVERSRLEQRAGSETEFVGAVVHDRVGELLAHARALAVPSRCYEGSPIVVLEALSAGVGVIASRMGGLEEVLDGSGAGQLVAPEDVDAWADALGSLDDDLEVERSGAAAYELWQRRFSPVVALRALEDAYSEALQSVA